MVSMVLLRISPSWPLSKSRLIQYPTSATLTRDTLVGFPHCQFCLACLGLTRFVLLRFECRFKVPDLEHLEINPDLHHKQAQHKQYRNNIHSNTYFYIQTKPCRMSWSGQLAPDNSVWNNTFPAKIINDFKKTPVKNRFT